MAVKASLVQIPNLCGEKLGRFEVGPKIHKKNTSLVECIQEYLGWGQDVNLLLTLKILSTPCGSERGTKECEEFRNGRLLLHNEYNVLCLLQDVPGLLRQYGLHREIITHQGQDYECVVLAVDYPVSFGHLKKNLNLVNLQQYVIQEKRLSEKKAVTILHNLVKIVHTMHERNIVHRDLKLCNMLLCTRTLNVTIVNFSLSKLLISDDELLRDQRGSLAYVSPDVLSGLPYNGKCSDMWAVGVLLYTMLYGQFPFYDGVPEELFRRISAADYCIPRGIPCSFEVQTVIEKLLELDSRKRMTVSALIQELECIMSQWTDKMDCNLSTVPQGEVGISFVGTRQSRIPCCEVNPENFAVPVQVSMSVSATLSIHNRPLPEVSHDFCTVEAAQLPLSKCHPCVDFRCTEEHSMKTSTVKDLKSGVHDGNIFFQCTRCSPSPHSTLYRGSTLCDGEKTTVVSHETSKCSTQLEAMSTVVPCKSTRNGSETPSYVCPSTPVLSMSASNFEYLFGSDHSHEHSVDMKSKKKPGFH